MTTCFAALASGAQVPLSHWTEWGPYDEREPRSWRSWDEDWWASEAFWVLMGSRGNTWRVGR